MNEKVMKKCRILKKLEVIDDDVMVDDVSVKIGFGEEFVLCGYMD